MLFNSIQFFIFFTIVASVYFAVAQRWQWLFLLLASCYFYMAFAPGYLIILFLIIAVDYWAGILIEESEGRARKFYLVVSIFSTCLVLFFFKYFNFFNSAVVDLAKLFNIQYAAEHLKIVLPIGLSFHTFQSLSYVIEVYRGNQKAERHFGIYAVFVMFFPQLVAGPIERAKNLLHQFRWEHRFDYARVTDGLKLALWGLFKKAVIADRLSHFVNQVYGNPHDYQGWPLIIATIFFAFQIYCDFSGYSDIAIGTAQVLGFKLMDNFDRPYYSKSISEFWKRWHISLTSWFKDYVYIPLGGNRMGKARWYLNLIIVFLLSGLWHGANWTFLIWGGLNGFYLLCSIWTTKIRYRMVRAIGLDQFPGVHKVVKIMITFSLISFAWIFFRANTVSDAFYIATHLFAGLGDPRMLQVFANGFGYNSFVFVFLVLALLEGVHFHQRKHNLRHLLVREPAPLRFLVYASIVGCILLFGDFSMRQFIYFQF